MGEFGPRRIGSVHRRLRPGEADGHLTSIAVCLGHLAYGHAVDGKDENSDGSWFAGLAAIEPTTFIKGEDWPGTIVPNILIANVPQLIFSILYFMANSVWTSMALAAEWNSYSVHRKGLRVSTFLRGHQRSTYFLSLPYRYALPLISCSGLLHWLISQSLYVVIIRARGVNHERDPALDSATCAYSPVGIISSVSVGAFMLACLIGIGCRRFKSGMPVAGSCCLAIAAACHSSYVQKDDDDDDDDEDDDSEKLGAEYQRLKWGVETLIPEEIEAEIGHCTFSSGEVEMPQNGTVYL